MECEASKLAQLASEVRRYKIAVLRVSEIRGDVEYISENHYIYRRKISLLGHRKHGRRARKWSRAADCNGEREEHY